MAYNAIHPIDAAGVILRGLSGSGDSRPTQPSGSHWMNQKMQMLQWFNLFGKKK